MVQNHRIHVIDEDEFDGLMAVMISQPTDVLEPQIFSEMIDGVDGCVVGC